MRPQTEREIYQRRQHGSAHPGQAEQQHRAHQAGRESEQDDNDIAPAVDHGARNRAEAQALLAERDVLRARVATQTGAEQHASLAELGRNEIAMRYAVDQDTLYDARQAETAGHRAELNKVCSRFGLGRWLDPGQRRAAMLAAAAAPVASLAAPVAMLGVSPPADVIVVPAFAMPAADATDAATARAGWLGRAMQALMKLR